MNELLLDQQQAADLRFEVKRVGGNSRSKDASSRMIKDEALVVFETARDRDDVRSFARNLERRGRGLRLKIPDHLWASFRALQSVGYELKQRNPGLKRNVLFVRCKEMPIGLSSRTLSLIRAGRSRQTSMSVHSSKALW